MYEASSDSQENWNTMEEIIRDYGWDGMDVLRYLTDWHGMQLLDREFMENLINCEL